MDNDSPEAEWVARVQRGDDRAFEELMGRYKRPVLNFVYRMTGDATEAEDIALAVFVRAYRALTASGFRRRDAEFSTWLFQIARNAAVDFLRHRSRRPTVPLLDGDGEAGHAAPGRTAPQELVALETGAQIAAAVAELPEDQRTAIVLAEYEDRSQAEIAAIMKTSLKSVEARLYRARQFLRRRLAPLLGADEDSRQNQ